MVVLKGREQGGGDTINKSFLYLALSRTACIIFMLLNIGMIIVSPLHCSLPFYTTIAFKSYIPLTFSERMFFISVTFAAVLH